MSTILIRDYKKFNKGKKIVDRNANFVLLAIQENSNASNWGQYFELLFMKLWMYLKHEQCKTYIGSAQNGWEHTKKECIPVGCIPPAYWPYLIVFAGRCVCPAMHAPLPCTPPPLPHITPAMHAPAMHTPLPCTPPMYRQTRVKTWPSQTSFAGGKNCSLWANACFYPFSCEDPSQLSICFTVRPPRPPQTKMT